MAEDQIELYRFSRVHSLTRSNMKIINVVPADFNHDGRLDLLVMYEDRQGGWWGGDKVQTLMEMFPGVGTEAGTLGTFSLTVLSLPRSLRC